MIKNIRVGTRPSNLALRQVEEVSSLLPGLKFEVITIATQGDKDKKTKLVDKEDSNFFTYEIEEALLAGDIDMAIHSAKDLEINMPKELLIIAMTKAISPWESLVSKDNITLRQLPKKSIIGTSSANRKKALTEFRDDFIIKDIRGDIEDRLGQLDAGKFQAIIVAHAALIRLNLEYRIAEIIPKEIMYPHPLQGRLAIQIRRDRADTFNIFRSLNDEEAW